MELLLAVTLLAGLMAAAVFGFSSLQRTVPLNEGVERVETAMRFARAHAANTGRKVQVVVTSAEAQGGAATGSSSGTSEAARTGESNPSLSILWEADPARAPGVFEPIPSLSAEVADVSELVEIRSVGRDSKGQESLTTSTESDGVEPAVASSGTRSMGTTTGQETESGNDLGSETAFGATSSGADIGRGTSGANPGETTITFYPDGSCDGATIVLASRDADDAREVAVHLESVTGTTRRQWKESSTGASATETGDSTSPNKSSTSGSTTGTSTGLPSGSSVADTSRSVPQSSPRTTASTTTARGRR